MASASFTVTVRQLLDVPEDLRAVIAPGIRNVREVARTQPSRWAEERFVDLRSRGVAARIIRRGNPCVVYRLGELGKAGVA